MGRSFATIPAPETQYSVAWARRLVIVLREIFSQPNVQLDGYTVASIPPAGSVQAGTLLFISDESGGAVPAFSDGTNWRRVTDRAVIS